MSLTKLAALCDDFMGAADFPLAMQSGLADDIEGAMTDAERDVLGQSMLMALGGNVDNSTVNLAEVFATVAYRLSREDEAAAYINVTQTDGQTAQELRAKSAPNMAKLVELARP
jgi:hypothetical protein